MLFRYSLSYISRLVFFLFVCFVLFLFVCLFLGTIWISCQVEINFPSLFSMCFSEKKKISFLIMESIGNGQGGLACCDSWGLKESDMTEQLN